MILERQVEHNLRIVNDDSKMMNKSLKEDYFKANAKMITREVNSNSKVGHRQFNEHSTMLQ